MKAREWSPAQDSIILAMRREGASWLEVAAVLELSYAIVAGRGSILRARQRLPSTHAPAAPELDARNNRGALRAGHPLTWGIICNAPFPTPEPIKRTKKK